MGIPEKDMDIGLALRFMPADDRTACVVLFQFIPAAFPAYESDCHTIDRHHHTRSIDNADAQRFRHLSPIHDGLDGRTCRSAYILSGNNRDYVVTEPLLERILRSTMNGRDHCHHKADILPYQDGMKGRPELPPAPPPCSM